MKTFLILLIVSGIVGLISYKIGNNKGYEEATNDGIEIIEKMKEQCNSNMKEIEQNCLESMNKIKDVIN